MNSESQVNAMITGWKLAGIGKADMACRIAEATLGWPYVWGAVWAKCTTAKREYYMNRDVCPDGEKAQIRKNCQVLNGSAGSCDGCTYFPKGLRVLINDCQGWVKGVLKQVGITLTGGGCTSMYYNSALWTEQGEIRDMPDVVCCVFMRNGKDLHTMEHIGIHIGGGQIIHCSGTVKRGKTTDRGWTHYAIPKGLDGSLPDTRPTLRRGSEGKYVRELQEKLIELGYDLGSYGADGKFGAKTEAAVKLFQADHGLKQDGVVGKGTYAALDAATPGELYTVTIEHLQKFRAEALVEQYAGSASMKKEGEGNAD